MDEKPAEKPAETPAAPAPAAPAAPPTTAPVPEKPAGVAGLIGLIVVVVIGVAIGSFLTRGTKPLAGGHSASLAEGREAVAKGDRTRAAAAFSQVVTEEPDSGDAKEAREELAKLALASVAGSAPLHEAAVVLAAAFECTAPLGSGTIADACLRATAEATKDPAGACELTKVLFESTQGSEVLAARAAALDAAIAKDADDVELRVARAEIDLNAGDFKKAADRLEPFEEKLKDGDGARVLGLALMNTDREERAQALLRRFYDAHVDDFRRSLDGLRAADEKARAKALADLRAGEFSPAFQRRMDDADKETKKQLIDGWIKERVLRDPRVRVALRGRAAVRKLAEAAMGLGGIEVKLAADRPVERRAHLEAAERYYVSVLDVAAGDAQLLFVARVRFDLGREKDAQEVLEELFRRHGRTGDFLLALAVTFQRVGPARDATRALAEEAYSKLEDTTLKEKAAAIRASVATSTKDAVTWLERAGSAPPVRAMLAHGRAQVARDEGHFDDARKLIDEALSVLAPDGGDLAPPEQLGALRMERFTTTGDRSDLDASIATLEKAAAPDRARPPTLDLLADALLTRAIFDVVKDRVRTDVIRERSLELFHFAAKDEKDLESLVALLTANPDRQRAVELRERAIALDASRDESWEGLLADASARRDTGALETLAGRISVAPIDRAESRRRLQEYWSGQKDALYRDGIERKRKHADAVLALARAQNDPATIARALVARAGVERDAPGFGAPADPDLDVKLCEEAETLASRPSTRTALTSALLARALARLRPTEKALDELARAHLKLGSAAVLALAVAHDAGLADKVAKDEDVKRAATLVPGDGEPQAFHLRALTLAGSDAKDSCAKRLAASKLAFDRATTNFALTPDSPECVLDLATIVLARGEKEAAAKLIDRAKKDGVSLPFELLR